MFEGFDRQIDFCIFGDNVLLSEGRINLYLSASRSAFFII